MKLIDIGVNLTHEAFDADRSEILAKAQAVGVSTMIITGTDNSSNRKAQQLIEQYPQLLYATAGIHPHHASANMSSDLIIDLIHSRSVVAVGECGLDYYRHYTSPLIQRAVFERQLQIAIEHQMPVFTHLRDAFNDFQAVLSDYRADLGPVVVHCFTGTQAMVEQLIALDCHIGITGWICDERRGLHLREVIRHIPANRLMLETDAPYLLPRNLPAKPKGRRNVPAYLVHIAHTVANALNKSLSQLAAETTHNAQAFFRLPKSD